MAVLSFLDGKLTTLPNTLASELKIGDRVEINPIQRRKYTKLEDKWIEKRKLVLLFTDGRVFKVTPGYKFEILRNENTNA
jgi:hypothetical protein